MHTYDLIYIGMNFVCSTNISERQHRTSLTLETELTLCLNNGLRTEKVHSTVYQVFSKEYICAMIDSDRTNTTIILI